MKFNAFTKNAVATTGAVAFAMTMVAGEAVAADEKGKRVKCFGVVAKGQNDCATSTHSCAAQAKVDNHPEEWKYMPKGACEKLGGSIGKPKA